ncbi:MAG: 30S ribosomal protein S4, partial [Candidatus Bathyarchaeia archaeon]
MPENERKIKESILLKKLLRYGFVHEGSTLDDILNLTIEDILERRLQTIVWRKGLAKSPYQARQFIVHGHITMNGRVVRRPGMFVMVEDEDSIMLRADSPLKVVLEAQKG